MRAVVALLSLLLLTAGCGADLPSRSPTAAGPPTCENPLGRYRVSLPQGWWAHPADPSRGIEACSFLGPEPFEVALNNIGVLSGGSVRVQVVDSCLGYEEQPEVSDRLFIDGFPARREEFTSFSRVFWYVVELPDQSGDDRCEVGRFAYVRTDEGLPPDYEANKRAVDEIALSLDFRF